MEEIDGSPVQHIAKKVRVEEAVEVKNKVELKKVEAKPGAEETLVEVKRKEKKKKKKQEGKEEDGRRPQL
ncbi:unnamed protein product [Thlaspi arvense]|uniref:Uncharacterized protein n=1 Tax=Thlaspi arvense TaxID=13288 RepID=A0AAU9SKV8_THLAR|nr:unnamed protein product [Thlaspi arvense]